MKIAKLETVFSNMEKIGMPLLIHGEVTDAAVDVFDREAVFIREVLKPLIGIFIIWYLFFKKNKKISNTSFPRPNLLQTSAILLIPILLVEFHQRL